MERLKGIEKRLVYVALAGFLAGALWLVAVRFVTLQENEVHYHANFAVFVDGERLPFETFTFYEEVQACGGDEVNNPRTRVHMHDQINHVLHVHDAAATWGHFFANLGMANGDTVFKTDTATFTEGDDTQIRFVLNGQEVDTTANRTIESEDVLLVSIGRSTADELKAQYTQINQDAHEYNEQNDPSNCTGGKSLTFAERLKKAVGVFNY